MNLFLMLWFEHVDFALFRLYGFAVFVCAFRLIWLDWLVFSGCCWVDFGCLVEFANSVGLFFSLVLGWFCFMLMLFSLVVALCWLADWRWFVLVIWLMFVWTWLIYLLLGVYLGFCVGLLVIWFTVCYWLFVITCVYLLFSFGYCSLFLFVLGLISIVIALLFSSFCLLGCLCGLFNLVRCFAVFLVFDLALSFCVGVGLVCFVCYCVGLLSCLVWCSVSSWVFWVGICCVG